MELVVTLAMKFWQWTVLIALIVIGFIINLFGVDNKKERIGFSYKQMPSMKPVKIPTAGKGFWSEILMWLMGVRKWEIAENFHYKLNGVDYTIPKGFEFDGASVPKFLATFLSPTGVLLMGGLVHDYAYKYAALKPKNSNDPLLLLNQKEADKLFRDICIEQNGFHFLNYLAYWGLRIGGFVAWNGHRKRNAKIED